MYQGFLRDVGILFYFILIRFLAKKSDSVFLIRLVKEVIFWQDVIIIYPPTKFLELEIREYIALNDSFEIQVFAGGQYHQITLEQALNTYCSDAPEWHLFAGLKVRVKKGGGVNENNKTN